MAHPRPPLLASSPRDPGRHHDDGLAAPGDSGGAASRFVGGASEAWLSEAVALPWRAFEDVPAARTYLVCQSDRSQPVPKPTPGRNRGGVVAACSAAAGGDGGGGDEVEGGGGLRRFRTSAASDWSDPLSVVPRARISGLSA